MDYPYHAVLLELLSVLVASILLAVFLHRARKRGSLAHQGLWSGAIALLCLLPFLLSLWWS